MVVLRVCSEQLVLFRRVSAIETRLTKHCIAASEVLRSVYFILTAFTAKNKQIAAHVPSKLQALATYKIAILEISRHMSIFRRDCTPLSRLNSPCYRMCSRKVVVLMCRCAFAKSCKDIHCHGPPPVEVLEIKTR